MAIYVSSKERLVAGKPEHVMLGVMSILPPIAKKIIVEIMTLTKFAKSRSLQKVSVVRAVL